MTLLPNGKALVRRQGSLVVIDLHNMTISGGLMDVECRFESINHRLMELTMEANDKMISIFLLEYDGSNDSILRKYSLSTALLDQLFI